MTPSQIATIANQRVLAGLFIFGGLVVTPLTTTAQQTGIPDGIVDSTGSPKEQILQAFQKRIQLTRNEVDRLETRLGPLQHEADDLIRRLSATKPPADIAQPDETPQVNDDEPNVVDFRPPKAYVSKKKSSIGLVFEDGRVFVLDFGDGAIAKANQLITEVRYGIKPVGNHTFRGSENSDFDVKVTMEKVSSSSFRVGVQPVHRNERSGETADDALQSNSRFLKAVKGVNRFTQIVQCVVYPDSFDAFRTLRQEIWSLKKEPNEPELEVGWDFMGAGESIGLGSGPIGGQ